MDCCIVSKNTIDAIVSIWLALEYEAVPEPVETMQDVADKAGQILWDANVLIYSKLLRIGKRYRTYTFEHLTIEDLVASLPIAAIEIRFLEKQCLEDDNWLDMPASMFLSNLIERIWDRTTPPGLAIEIADLPFYKRTVHSLIAHVPGERRDIFKVKYRNREAWAWDVAEESLDAIASRSDG